MIAMLRNSAITIAVLLLGLTAHTLSPPFAAAGGAAGPQVLRSDQLTRKQFDQQLKRLPDTAVVESKGRRLIVGEIKAKLAQTVRGLEAKGQEAARAAQAKFAARQAQFKQQQQAKLTADNAKVTAELARLRQVAAIQQEAAQLSQHSKTASPAERAQIEQRAGQLLQQLQQLGR